MKTLTSISSCFSILFNRIDRSEALIVLGSATGAFMVEENSAWVP
ncbi:Hypothetical protein Cul131001_0940 [Corynebacterium ulcerans]|nr:Hypothetical protein Cul131001_0940 [Corynebacterium ulcerans]